MNIRTKTRNSVLVAFIVLAMVLSPTGVFADNHAHPPDLEDLLPQYNNFSWTYSGSVEYGHAMEIESIAVVENSTEYSIEGNVYDASGGESDADYSLELQYSLQSDVILQTKSEEMMLDSDYDEIELIRTPLEVGSSWNQDVENPEGDETTLESTITEVEDTDEGIVFTVRYEDLNSDYYEERKIQEGLGVISFEKQMTFEEDSFPMGYSLYEAASGVEMDMDFNDVTGEEWYMDYVSKLVTLDLIEGYPDGSFKADGEITVAEFIKMTVESLSHYEDMGPEIWYEPYVSKATELELIEEDQFEDFNRPITREEMTKIIVKASGEELQGGQLDFSDADEIDDEFSAYVYTAVQLGIIDGYPSDNTFRGNQTSTRAEATKLFVILVEDMIGTDEFKAEDSLVLETEFESRLYQETEDDSWVVRDFDNKEDLIDHISEIADRQLAATYVDNYYDYMDGELVIPPKNGITTIIEDRDYQLEMVHPREYQMVQETSTELVGDYTITIVYRYENDGWIMQDRDLVVH